MKIKDLELHDKLYSNLLNEDVNKIFKPRVQILDLFQKKIKKISGNVLDIGAGTGYASIWLAMNTDTQKVTAIDSSEIAVKKLIPKNLNHFNLRDKIDVIHGDFSQLKYEDHFDYIVSFGSIHHSNCLFETMTSLSKYLKNGGYLIMNEPTMSNFTTNEEYIQKYNTEEIFQGMKIKNYERNDKFFRKSEYITAACYSNFDLKYKGEFKEKTKIRNIISSFFKKKKNKVINKPVSMIYFFEKKKTSYIPHLWKNID